MPEQSNRPPVAEHYEGLSGDYDQRWSDYIQASTEATLNCLPGSPGAILDVGCGTGVQLQHCLARFPVSSLSGVDATSAMLDQARQKLPPAVDLQQARAENLPFKQDRFNSVISNSMLHYLSEPSAAIAEMVRVLQPGGTLVVTDWCGDYMLMKWLARYLKVRRSPHQQTLKAEQLQRFLENSGIVEIRVNRYKINWFWGLMTVSGVKQ